MENFLNKTYFSDVKIREKYELRFCLQIMFIIQLVWIVIIVKSLYVPG